LPPPDLRHEVPSPAERQTARLVAGTILPQRDLLALARRLQGRALDPSAPDPAETPGYGLGDPLTFWVHDIHTTSFFTTTAFLGYETPHAYWWIEDGFSIQAEDLERSARNFEHTIYPTNRRQFGSEWDPGIDGDPHIYIFLGDVPGVGGYFSGPDEYPAEVRPYSNEHEMFYINLRNAMPGSSYFDGILAHEFQHMIHWSMDRDEDTWVNEGLSELAGQINGYDVGSTDILFSLNPDTQLTTWPELDDSGAHYGASYLFLSYFLEQYGPEAIRQLVAEPANGATGFEAVLARVDPDRTFDDLFADWVVANYLDNEASAGSHYGYADLQIDQPRLDAQHTAYPVERQSFVHQYATDYVLLEGTGTLTIEFLGSPLVSLAGNRAHSGDYQWWSKRGDEGDATLTRSFDLTGLEEATLQAWIWYELEDDFDYAYVEVSTDGGATWDLLANDLTTLANPNGNSYGPAFTGTSGGGSQPEWVQTTFDLGAYVGQPILVRFEVITDESVNHAGLCLDDIAIPELGYSDDAEQDDGGWHAAGWVRATSDIPQAFIVQLITVGQESRVERMILDGEMQGSLQVTGFGDEIERAILLISALASHTTEPAAYTYHISQQ
jgi:immune inhibitor A